MRPSELTFGIAVAPQGTMSFESSKVSRLTKVAWMNDHEVGSKPFAGSRDGGSVLRTAVTSAPEAALLAPALLEPLAVLLEPEPGGLAAV